MRIFKYPVRKDWKEIITRPVFSIEEAENKVLPILNAVEKEGDAALFRFTEQFDKVSLDQLSVSSDEIASAASDLSTELKEAIKIAAKNIEKFHLKQVETFPKVETTEGVECWRKSIAIEKVGLYIPGGSAPLFSTVLMLGIPAKIAGCDEVILCSPPGKDGKIHPAILFCCDLVGINKIYKVGGAQAVAAMAYGTQSIPKVFKIFGPGNQYVTVAKQLINRIGTAIDMPAGPSEVAVLADQTGEASFIAADLLSQAEHGPDSQVLLVTTDEKLLAKIEKEVELQLELLPRKELIKKSLNNSRLVLVNTIEEGIDLLNEYAPEHLILQVLEAAMDSICAKIKNAGSVFIGKYTPEAAGDYASGTNHTLPTNGYATAYAGVSVDSFVKKVTFQRISEAGLKTLGPVIEKMAEAEQLFAHKNAVTLRLNSIK